MLLAFYLLVFSLPVTFCESRSVNTLKKYPLPTVSLLHSVREALEAMMPSGCSRFLLASSGIPLLHRHSSPFPQDSWEPCSGTKGLSLCPRLLTWGEGHPSPMFKAWEGRQVPLRFGGCDSWRDRKQFLQYKWESPPQQGVNRSSVLSTSQNWLAEYTRIDSER